MTLTAIYFNDEEEARETIKQAIEFLFDEGLDLIDIQADLLDFAEEAWQNSID